jgi:hypothetical protein
MERDSMKKLTLLMIFLCTVSLSFGQILPIANPSPVSIGDESYLASHPNFTKEGGRVIWETTFNWADPSNPRGWSLPEGWLIVDSSDVGNPWTWLIDTLKWGTSGRLSAPSFFTTKDDGFIAMPINSYNQRDGLTTTVAANSYFQTCGIDCSAVSSVVVKFTQVFALCCLSEAAGNLEMLVSNDGGGHWATYDVQFDVQANTTTPLRFQNPEINISDVAAGLPNILIRFFFHNGNQWYYWMIDDLKLVEGYDNDLVLEDTWLEFDGGFGETIDQIHFWPLSQMGMAGATSGTVGANYIKGAILNRGKNDSEAARLDLKVLKNGTEIFSDVSPSADIWTLDRDTGYITNPYLATDYGDYRFLYTATSNNNEEIPGNNSAFMNFTVTDTLAHRADLTAEQGVNTGGWVGGNNAGDMMCVFYNLYAPVEINSITAYLWGWTPSETPQFQYVLFKEIEGENIEWMVSEVMDMNASLTRSWVTLPMVKDGETEFLEPGIYATCVRMWGVNPTRPNGTQGMSVGRDLSTKFAGCAQYYATSGWTGLATSPLPMIGFNINQTGSPKAAGVTFNVDLNKPIASGEFNPATDVVEVYGLASSWNGKLTMTDPDGDGIYTATAESLPVNSTLNYKYSINGTPEEYPLTGNLYRTYWVGYWNNLDDTYNFGTPVFVFNVDMNAEITKGTFIPGTDTLEVNGLGNKWKTVATMTDPDGDGIYSKAISNILYNVTINYKYSINGVLEAYPLTGDPFRSWTAKYWNYVQDKYNAAGTSGLNPIGLETAFQVYPNPTSGEFTVNISNTVNSDLTITLTNIEGQVIYRNVVKNVMNHQETIDNQLAKGLYFLSVNNGKEVKVQKVVVQ